MKRTLLVILLIIVIALILLFSPETINCSSKPYHCAFEDSDQLSGLERDYYEKQPRIIGFFENIFNTNIDLFTKTLFGRN